jgi:hypothetical protein
MFDIAMLSIVVLFFALAIGYAGLCYRLLTAPTGPDRDVC